MGQIELFNHYSYHFLNHKTNCVQSICIIYTYFVLHKFEQKRKKVEAAAEYFKYINVQWK